MANRSGDEEGDFRNIKIGVRLLTAFRSDLSVRAQDSPEFQAALAALTDFPTGEEMAAEFERVVQGLVLLASVLVGQLAEARAEPASAVMGELEQRTEEFIARLRRE